MKKGMTVFWKENDNVIYSHSRDTNNNQLTKKLENKDISQVVNSLLLWLPLAQDISQRHYIQEEIIKLKSHNE